MRASESDNLHGEMRRVHRELKIGGVNLRCVGRNRLAEEYMMKIGLSIEKIGLKIWLTTALLLLGFITTESAYATARTELADITLGNASNESVSLMLFGFVIGVSALLFYIIVFKPAAKASIAKWFHKILRKVASRDSDSPSFLHDDTKGVNHTGTSSASHTTPPLKKTDKLIEKEEKTSLDDDKK